MEDAPAEIHVNPPAPEDLGGPPDRRPGARSVDPLMGLFRELTSMTELRLSEDAVDKTGRSPKLTFSAVATYTATPDSVRGGAMLAEQFRKPVFMSVSVPNSTVLSVDKGSPSLYPKPAVREPEYAVVGGYKDARGQIDFYNNVNGSSGCYGTAAVMQLAVYYVQNHVLPSLGMPSGNSVFPEVSADPDSYTPGPDVTSFMPNELTSRHDNATLCMLYHVLTAEDVLTSAGYVPNVKRVLNRCGRLPATDFSLETFQKVMYVVQHSLCGVGSTDQFVCDFCLAVMQLFPIHGLSKEGGVWRELYKTFVVCPNSVVAVSNVTKDMRGYGVSTDNSLIMSGVVLQTIISRAIVEADLDAKKLVIPPRATNDMAREVLGYHFIPIYEALSRATRMPVDYWKTQLAVDCLVEAVRNRHLSTERPVFLGDFCPFMTSYSCDVEGSKLGSYEYDKSSNTPLTFTGNYKIRRYDDDGFIDCRIDSHERRDFTNGLLYLDPKVNPADGLMSLKVSGFVMENTGKMLDSTELVSGQILTRGHDYGEYMWRNNGDVLPCGGEVRTIDKGYTLLTGAGVPKWCESGKYEVSVSKYVVCTSRSGEARASGKTRRSLIEKRFGNDYSMLEGLAEYDNRDIDDFTQNFLKLTGRKRAMLKNRIEREQKVYDETVKGVVTDAYNNLGLDVTQVEETIDRLAREVLEDDSSLALYQKVLDDVQVGELSAVSSEAKEAVRDLKKVFSDIRFVEVDAEDVVAGAPKSGNSKPRLSWGFIPRQRDWDAARYISEMTRLLGQARMRQFKDYNSAKLIIGHIAGEDSVAEFESRIDIAAEANRLWQREEKRRNLHIQERVNTPAEIVEADITAAIAGTVVPEDQNE